MKKVKKDSDKLKGNLIRVKDFLPSLSRLTLKEERKMSQWPVRENKYPMFHLRFLGNSKKGDEVRFWMMVPPRLKFEFLEIYMRFLKKYYYKKKK